MENMDRKIAFPPQFTHKLDATDEIFAVDPHASSFESVGWGFESLRAHKAEHPSLKGVLV
jgi:hypothetical protein